MCISLFLFTFVHIKFDWLMIDYSNRFMFQRSQIQEVLCRATTWAFQAEAFKQITVIKPSCYMQAWLNCSVIIGISVETEQSSPQNLGWVNTGNHSTARSDNAALLLRVTELTLGWFFVYLHKYLQTYDSQSRQRACMKPHGVDQPLINGICKPNWHQNNPHFSCFILRQVCVCSCDEDK